MKKISGLLMLPLLLATLTACGTSVVRGSEVPNETKASVTQSSAVSKTKPVQATKPAQVQTAPGKTDAAVTQAGTSTPLTLPAETTPLQTMPPETVPATIPASTQAPAPGKTISNLPQKLQAELDKPGNGLLIIYEPQQYKGIRQAVTWDIRSYNTNTKVLAVIKHKGSTVAAMDSEMAEDGPYSLPGKAIRTWKTTSDYEVIRILNTDPPSFVLNFIRVTEPDGHVTTAPIESTSRDVGPYRVIPYDED